MSKNSLVSAARLKCANNYPGETASRECLGTISLQPSATKERLALSPDAEDWLSGKAGDLSGTANVHQNDSYHGDKGRGSYS